MEKEGPDGMSGLVMLEESGVGEGEVPAVADDDVVKEARGTNSRVADHEAGVVLEREEAETTHREAPPETLSEGPTRTKTRRCQGPARAPEGAPALPVTPERVAAIPEEHASVDGQHRLET